MRTSSSEGCRRDERARLDLVEETVAIDGVELRLARPRDPEALLDEEAFEHEEFLPYWAELWPSAVALAGAIAGRQLAGLRVLELGCGLALPSLTAAASGARVVASDWSAEAIALVRANARRNGVELEAVVSSWTDPRRLIAGAPWALVLASDVLYERRNVGLLLELLPRLVDERGEVLVAEPGRPAAAAFFAAAADGWHVRRVDTETPGVPVWRLRKFGVRPVHKGVTSSSRDCHAREETAGNGARPEASGGCQVTLS